MQLLALLVLVIVISIALKNKPKRSSKPKDEIRLNFAKGKHYGLTLDKKIVRKNGIDKNMTTAIFLSSYDKDRKKTNIPLKKNPDPKKVKLKKKLDRQLKQKKISKEQYDEICKREKVNSYFIKQIKDVEENTFFKENLVETQGWTLDPDDRQLAYDIYHTHLKNKEELERARATKAAEKSKKKMTV